MARDSHNGHGIRIPGQVLDDIRTKEENGDYSKDSRYGTKRKKVVSRKDKRKEERRLKKQKRHPTDHKNGLNFHRELAKSTYKDSTKSDDPLAALAALKAKKSKDAKTPKSNVKEDDPLDTLRKLKKNKKSLEIRIVKEDDIDDDDFDEDDFDNSDEVDFDEDLGSLEEFAGFDLEEDDPLEKLRALKGNKKSSDSIRIVKEDDLEDSEDLEKDLNDDTDDAPEYSDKGKFEDHELDDDDFDEEDFDVEDFDEEEDSDPLEKLRALKAKKKGKESIKEKKKEKVIEATFVDPDENDMEFYAKKLGLKDAKSKLSKSGDDDDIGGLLDGLDFDYLDDEEDSQAVGSDVSESGSESEYLEHEKENPFVAPVTESRYVPPALRKKASIEATEISPEIRALQKSIKGPINKLSETNIGSIVNEINSLFMNNARQSVTENLTSIILDSVVQQGRLLDTFVYLHAALVAAIYRLQGVDFGAHFIQTLIENFEKSRADPTKTKETLNMMSILSSVYAFQLVSSKLLYDIIRVLIDELSESNAELLLKIVRTSGNQMRSDDPSALKEIVLQVTKMSASLDDVSAKMLFLIETITSLKNNKLKDHNEATHQLAIRLKKFLGTFSGKAADPLQVGLDDILNVDTRGKWWLVGSAWKGDEGVGKADLVNKEVMNDILDNADVNWLELARAQRMNTDIRRAIFISIMSANDYIDAVTKLDKLALKKAQEREIPRIVIHCAVVEPAWNPYYGILAAKLCESHSYRKTFQFMLWDLIKGFEGSNGDDSDDDDVFSGFDDSEDDDEKLKKILNLGRFYGYLFAEGSLALHILRTLNFVTASTDNKLFMEVLFVTFLDQVGRKSQVNSVGVGLGKKGMSEQKFDDRILIERLLKAKEQPGLLQGIQHFINKRLRSSDFITGKKQKKRIEWGVHAMSDIIDEFVKEYDF